MNKINSKNPEHELISFMDGKISIVSRVILLIAMAGFLAYGILEYLSGVTVTFIVGVVTSALLVIPLAIILTKRIELGIIVFTVIMICAMFTTQFFYLDRPELFGLLLIDFSVFAGLVISCGFILVNKRFFFITVIVISAINIVFVALSASTIPVATKRFFVTELFIVAALGVLVYYFSFLYTTLIRRATLEAERQKNANEYLTKVNTVFGRFVPDQFIKLLDKENISDIQFGDQIQKNMTIMFEDIRSFTSLSESMTPKETFEFLNSLLKFVGPTIRNYGGYIDKYIGDAVMSIFPEKPEDAIIAGIEIQKLLELYNVERAKQGKKAVHMGIGINTGDVIAGIIGEEERMQETVISDAVNLASRLESLTKLYGVSMIVSGESLERCGNKDMFKYRFLDQIQVAGKILPVSIYEILDADDTQTQAIKLELAEEYQNGWQLFCDGRIEEAITAFFGITKKNPRDAAAELFLKRCREYLHDRTN